jgi:hypothetical protein
MSNVTFGEYNITYSSQSYTTTTTTGDYPYITGDGYYQAVLPKITACWPLFIRTNGDGSQEISIDTYYLDNRIQTCVRQEILTGKFDDYIFDVVQTKLREAKQAGLPVIDPEENSAPSGRRPIKT